MLCSPSTWNTFLKTFLALQAAFKKRVEHIRTMARSKDLTIESGWYTKLTMKTILGWDKLLGIITPSSSSLGYPREPFSQYCLGTACALQQSDMVYNFIVYSPFILRPPNLDCCRVGAVPKILQLYFLYSTKGDDQRSHRLLLGKGALADPHAAPRREILSCCGRHELVTL